MREGERKKGDAKNVVTLNIRKYESLENSSCCERGYQLKKRRSKTVVTHCTLGWLSASNSAMSPERR